MSFRLVPKSVTLNDLERRNGLILRYFAEFGSVQCPLRKRGCVFSGISLMAIFTGHHPQRERYSEATSCS